MSPPRGGEATRAAAGAWPAIEATGTDRTGCAYCCATLGPGGDPARPWPAECGATRPDDPGQSLASGDLPAGAVVLGAREDPYQPDSSRPAATRALLSTLRPAGRRAVIVTRSPLVVNDLDLLSTLANENRVRIFVAIGTLDASRAHCLEPQAPAPVERLDAIRRMAAAGLHAGVLLAPVIPGLTATELEPVLESAAASGAGYADYAMVSIPESERPSFAGWLLRNCPERSRVVAALLDAIGPHDPATAGLRAPGGPPPSYRELFERRFEVARRRFLLERIPAPLCCGRLRFPSASTGHP